VAARSDCASLFAGSELRVISRTGCDGKFLGERRRAELLSVPRTQDQDLSRELSVRMRGWQEQPIKVRSLPVTDLLLRPEAGIATVGFAVDP